VSFGRLLGLAAALHAFKTGLTSKLPAPVHDVLGHFAFRTGRLVHSGDKAATVLVCC
jgi:hypothetical protein